MHFSRTFYTSFHLLDLIRDFLMSFHTNYRVVLSRSVQFACIIIYSSFIIVTCHAFFCRNTHCIGYTLLAGIWCRPIHQNWHLLSHWSRRHFLLSRLEHPDFVEHLDYPTGLRTTIRSISNGWDICHIHATWLTILIHLQCN